MKTNKQKRHRAGSFPIEVITAIVCFTLFLTIFARCWGSLLRYNVGDDGVRELIADIENTMEHVDEFYNGSPKTVQCLLMNGSYTVSSITKSFKIADGAELGDKKATLRLLQLPQIPDHPVLEKIRQNEGCTNYQLSPIYMYSFSTKPLQ